MIHGEDGIGIFEQEGLEHGIGWIRAARVYAFGLQGMKRRNNGVDFFVSQMSAFARVGVKAGNEDDRIGYAELMAQVVFKNTDNRLD